MDGESVAVVGAGLAGLVAARRLAASGADVTVVERRSTVGGRVRTETRDGFTLDRGFQVLFTAYPAVRRELDLDALDLRYFRPGAVIARPGSRSVLSDPLRDLRSAPASIRNAEVTLSDKLRTLLLRQHVGTRTESEVFRAADRSIRSYLREWGFSEDYVEHFVAPFYGGITLDRSLSTSKRVFEYTFKALSDGQIAVPAAGMRAIPEQLAERARTAGASIRCSERVESIDEAGGNVTVETEAETMDVDVVVVAADPKEARRLTGVESIPVEARGCVTQYYRLPAEDAPRTGRKILLNAADPSPNTVVPMSEVAPEYAPDGTALFNATFLGDAALERDASALAEETRLTLESWYPERDFSGLEPVRTHRIEFAQFDQPPGIHESLPDARAPGGSTYLAGDYTAWSSIQGAMRSGREAARAVERDR
ncbi:NAD(P)/FAD-dependent oxidoreductase [Halobellus limi]|uniref:NAD(P)/FAD-dependent oxidoreductase n=1 Tax=Halobellus limi TaxID=699433 RepID=A0A1H5Z4T3_9EURY|nr:NAD(P)/FAD-dependent oxidoreductase [Halobellus limi]QCC48244.1 NAD(P)/FAD-dependent oxidoreductase [Halobellus limi]SEG30655.1 UDP-galactopyranose mutase [Halobellus limi]